MPYFNVFFEWTEVHYDNVVIEANDQEDATEIAKELLLDEKLQGQSSICSTFQRFEDFSVEDVLMRKAESEPEYFLYRNNEGKIRGSQDNY